MTRQNSDSIGLAEHVQMCSLVHLEDEFLWTENVYKTSSI